MSVSIIVPAYNSASTIKECIEAIKSQNTQEKFEVIVVDDGSTDNTAEIAKKCGAKVFSQSNSGPARARNLGAQKAKGEILVFTDSDCVPEKNWLTEMLAPFSEAKVSAVQGAYRTRQKGLVARFVQAEIEERYQRMKRRASKLDWIGSYSAAYRKNDFSAAGGFDESFPKASGEDPELSYKLQEKGHKLVFNPKAIVYHAHPDSLVKYFRTKFYRGFYRVPLYKKHAGKAVRDSYTPQTLKIQIVLMYATSVFLLLFALTTLAGIQQIHFGLSALTLGLFFISTIPLTLFALRRDFAVGFITPFMIFVRTLAFCTGLITGALK